MIKFATDGAVLSNSTSNVQGTIKVIPVDDSFKPIPKGKLPAPFHEEIRIYYYIGKYELSYLCYF